MSSERKKEICLSPDILTDVFHYCSRKNLAQIFSYVNFQFWHSSKYVSTLHVFHAIDFWPTVTNIHPKRRGSIVSKRFEDLLIPPSFVRFQNVGIYFQHNKSLQSFLESSKHSFVGSELNIEIIKQSEEQITQTIEVLNTSLMDLYSIRIAGDGISLYRFLPTKGVLNCDKLIITKMRLTSDTTVTFANWLHWKREHKNSRRHLIFDLPHDLAFIYDIVSWLKEAFLTATSPVNYVVSFVQCMKYLPIPVKDMQFCLENKETGERLTMFKFPGEENRKKTFRIWRRIPIQDDNQKNFDAEHLSMLSGECVANDCFDKDFYDF